MDHTISEEWCTVLFNLYKKTVKTDILGQSYESLKLTKCIHTREQYHRNHKCLTSSIVKSTYARSPDLIQLQNQQPW